MSALARALLERLVDKAERLPDRTRAAGERPPERFASAEERTAFDALLIDAQRVQAIAIKRGRGETAHLITRVVLRDVDALRAFLGRSSSVSKAQAARQAVLDVFEPKTEGSRDALNQLTEGWLIGRQPFRLGPSEIQDVYAFLSALDAVVLRDPLDRRDLRTYSRKATGNSKRIEEQAARIAGFMRKTGRLDPGLEDEDAMKALGLEKFPQPVLMAGPIRVASTDLSGLAYVGVAPEDAATIEPSGPVRTLLTIENLASFNRQVREARSPDAVIIYTGGFPSRAVGAALRAIGTWSCVEAFHWGDVDLGGLRIALAIATALGRAPKPHLMTPQEALRAGIASVPLLTPDLPREHLWAPLAEFLRSQEAHILEQEEQDPVDPAAQAA